MFAANAGAVECAIAALPGRESAANAGGMKEWPAAPPATRPGGVTSVCTYDVAHLSDSILLRDLATLVSRDRATTAQLLAHLAEFDARKLYLPAAYPSMYAYCVGELRMSEDAAAKRIQAARAARRFPTILEAVADGRLHLSAVCLLCPYLLEDSAADLLAAAAHKSKSAIEELLAERFPRQDLPTLIEALSLPSSAAISGNKYAPGHVGPSLDLAAQGQPGPQPSPEQVVAPAPPVSSPPHSVDRARLHPLAPERYALQVTIAKSTLDKLRYAQELLGHRLPASDVAGLLDRALDAYICQLERHKFAATDRPRQGRQPRPDSRAVPAEVRRAVWDRDAGQCTFVSKDGRRCPARTDLEFDHVDPYARGGNATVAGIRLRCRAHNQLDAERTYGAEFMRHKRIAAAQTREDAKARITEERTGEPRVEGGLRSTH